MKKVLNIILMCSFIIIVSCNGQSDYDKLKYVEVENKELRAFILEYLDEVDRGVTRIHILYEGIYLATHDIYVYEDDFVAPLTYTKLNDDIILFYSGQENMLYSEKRKRKAVELVSNKIPVVDSMDRASLSFIPPGYHPPSGILILCGDSLELLRYKEIGQDPKAGKHFNLFERNPCVIYTDVKKEEEKGK